ncbi:MAG: hypothetical protein ACLGPL_03805 [Acidobacteriota bacterium]
MQKRLMTFLVLLAAVAALMPFVCAAQTSAPAGGPPELAPFLGLWSGQYQECEANACDSRSVKVSFSMENGQPTVEISFGPGRGGSMKYGKSSGPVVRKFPAVVEKQNEASVISYTTKTGTKVVFKLQGNKLTGAGSGGRFTVSYQLEKAGN